MPIQHYGVKVGSKYNFLVNTRVFYVNGDNLIWILSNDISVTSPQKLFETECRFTPFILFHKVDNSPVINTY